MRLGINIDHVATLRNARGGVHPCPIEAAKLAEDAGANGITAHLREDRRHIRDEDIARLRAEVALPLNLEMAATDEMVDIALKAMPHAVCIVPEKREELTTEGGLDVIGCESVLTDLCTVLKQQGIRVSFFVGADAAQLEAAKCCGADIVELHTGHFCESRDEGELDRICRGARLAEELGLECHAGHGLCYETVRPVAAIPQIIELNIGHFLIGQAIFVGLENAILTMHQVINQARGAA